MVRLKFKRSEQDRFKRLKEKWKKPRGIHNKMRESKKGIKPKIGYKKPEKEEIPRVENINELKKLEVKEVAVSSKVGKKKWLEIEKLCKEKKIKILNVRKFDKKKIGVKSDKKAKERLGKN
jgi:large subunit ribosomal protein L32e